MKALLLLDFDCIRRSGFKEACRGEETEGRSFT